MIEVRCYCLFFVCVVLYSSYRCQSACGHHRWVTWSVECTGEFKYRLECCPACLRIEACLVVCSVSFSSGTHNATAAIMSWSGFSLYARLFFVAGRCIPHAWLLSGCYMIAFPQSSFFEFCRFSGALSTLYYFCSQVQPLDEELTLMMKASTSSLTVPAPRHLCMHVMVINQIKNRTASIFVLYFLAFQH